MRQVRDKANFRRAFSRREIRDEGGSKSPPLFNAANLCFSKKKGRRLRFRVDGFVFARGENGSRDVILREINAETDQTSHRNSLRIFVLATLNNSRAMDKRERHERN